MKNVYAGVPVVIGKDGVEKIEEIDLDEKEKKEFMHSIDAVKALWKAASKIDPDLSCLLYTSPSPRDKRQSRMPSSA